MSVKNNTSVEEKIEALRELAAWFEGDEFRLDDASSKFKVAAELAREIERDLTSIKNEVTIIKESFESA